LSDGIPAAWLEARLEDDRRLRGFVDEWRARTLLVDAGARVRLSEAGFLVSDALFVELL
jgi:hypothetical protein